MPVKIKEYVAVELSERDCALVQRFLDWAGAHFGFTGKTTALDLSKKENVNKIPEADVAFMFALLEVLEGKHHRIAEALMTGVKAKTIVASFPRITIGGKRMAAQRRGWFEKMCERLNYSFKKMSFPNETFYVVEKPRHL